MRIVCVCAVQCVWCGGVCVGEGVWGVCGKWRKSALRAVGDKRESRISERWQEFVARQVACVESALPMQPQHAVSCQE